ncbi:MAG: DUF2163 domain-containing protein [Alphaproteobacteria bacterium]|nr:DUF2163 domain-containing protein [Alphaproteobacteria bacterium]MBV9199016.1 DUF2163 domain-containing protein [Alphaproteobacteria bacterium]MBV9378041.1 DUF2163 domain-containing protein [Alphaproteobacteria bacterium]MBV9815073.1 DUF2163 domain-containing protein [Alphaproteobacteria bacterium]
MKTASPELIALLAGAGQFVMADLYTITLVGGSVLRYSAAPTALSANGYTFALGPKFERSKTKVVIGTQVDELEVRIYTEPTDLVGGVPFLQAAWQGQLDGALLQLERAFMPSYGDTSPGTVILFAGRISDIECTRTGVDLKCRSHLELLNIQMPRRLWQASCTHAFGDAMCQFDRSSMQAIFPAGPGSTPVQIATSVTPSPPSLYIQGSLIGVTGANAGSSRTVASMSGGWVYVKLAFLSPISPGDQFQLLPGCDRTVSTCTNVFNNAIHFGGFPNIPTPETAV